MSPTMGIVAGSFRRGGGGGDPGAIPTTGLLAAYSVRRVVPAYAGALLRVRRSSDNAEQDIGADGSGNLDIGALAAFVGAGTGFVTTWYDQSGNAKHATQATAARQPVIAAAAVNGRPGIGFQDAGAVKGLVLPAGAGLSPVRSVVTVARLDYLNFSAVNAATGSFFTGLLARATQPWLQGSNSNTWSTPPHEQSFNDGVSVLTTVAPPDFSTPHVLVLLDVDGMTGAVTLDMAGGYLGSDRASANRSWEGYASEFLFYDTMFTTPDRQAVETSAMTYYGI